MKKSPRTKGQLLAENEDLRRRLEEAEETLRAIHEGEVDALVLSKPQGEVVFTLKGAESPYRVFVEAMNEGAATLDPDGTILYCNNRFAKMLELPADRVIGSSIYQFIPTTDRSGFESAFLEGELTDTTADISLMREGQELMPVHLSFNMLHGQDMPVLCMVAMDLTDHKRLEETLRQFNAQLEKRVEERTAELVRINDTLQDEIAERNRAEEALRESQALLGAVMENTSDPVYVKDRKSRILMCNPALEKVAGKPAAEIIGKTDGEYYEDLVIGQALRENDLRVMESGYSQTMEETVKTPDGDRIFLSSKAPYLNESGNIIGIIGISHDITERKRVEEELSRSRDELEIRVRERTAELEKTNRTLQELSSRLLLAQEGERKRIAVELHDTIGSCLNAVKYKIEYVLQLIGKDSNVTEESLNSVIPVIKEGIEECRRMQQDLRPSLLDDVGLLPTLSWFCRRYQTIYTGIKVDLEQTLEESDIPNALKIVMFRITQEGMNNIAKHSKADLVHLSLRKIDGRIELVLEDNGQGFDLQRALGSESTKRGLGLTSMRERTELSGGSFTIESARGQGTVIRATWSL
jgi:PAS domain S-box-containing protein